MGLINKLGIGLVSLGLLGAPDYTSKGLLENRVNAAEQAKSGQTKNVEPVESKENYTFNEVKLALGDRYSKLDDKQKKTVEENYKKGKDAIKFSYNSSMGVIYNKKSIDCMGEGEIEELNKFKISELKKEAIEEYLEAFPWIKKENIAEIDKDPRNPDKILIFYTEYYKDLDKNLTGMFDDIGPVYFMGRGLIYISDGLKKADEWYNSIQKKGEKENNDRKDKKK